MKDEERLKYEALNLLIGWETGRQVLNEKISQRRSHQCEAAEPAEPEVGDMGVAPCWTVGTEIKDMCDGCQQRDALTFDIKRMKKEQSKLRQKLQRAANALIAETVGFKST